MAINPARPDGVNPSFHSAKSSNSENVKVLGAQLAHSINEIDELLGAVGNSALTEEEAVAIYDHYVASKEYTKANEALIAYQALVAKGEGNAEELENLQSLRDKAWATLEFYKAKADETQKETPEINEAIDQILERNELESSLEVLDDHIHFLERQYLIDTGENREDLVMQLNQAHQDLAAAQSKLNALNAKLDASSVDIKMLEKIIGEATGINPINPSEEVDPLSDVEKIAKATETIFDRDNAVDEYNTAKKDLERLEKELADLKIAKENTKPTSASVGYGDPTFYPRTVEHETFFTVKEADLNARIAVAKERLATLSEAKDQAEIAYSNQKIESPDIFSFVEKQAEILRKEIELSRVDRDLDYLKELKTSLEDQLSKISAFTENFMGELQRLQKEINAVDAQIKALDVDNRKNKLEDEIASLKSQYDKEAAASDNYQAYRAAEKTADYLISKKIMNDFLMDVNIKKAELENFYDTLDQMYMGRDKVLENKTIKNMESSIQSAISKNQKSFDEAKKVFENAELIYNHIIGK